MKEAGPHLLPTPLPGRWARPQAAHEDAIIRVEPYDHSCVCVKQLLKNVRELDACQRPPLAAGACWCLACRCSPCLLARLTAWRPRSCCWAPAASCASTSTTAAGPRSTCCQTDKVGTRVPAGACTRTHACVQLLGRQAWMRAAVGRAWRCVLLLCSAAQHGGPHATGHPFITVHHRSDELHVHGRAERCQGLRP